MIILSYFKKILYILMLLICKFMFLLFLIYTFFYINIITYLIPHNIFLKIDQNTMTHL